MKRRFCHGFIGEMRHIRRHPFIALIMVAISLIYPFLLSSLYQKNKVVDRPVAIIDHDNSRLSRELVSMLSAAQGLNLRALLSDPENAREMLVERAVDMVIIIPEDFSRRIKLGKQGTINVWSYSANLLTYSTAYAALSESVLDLNAALGERTALTLGMGAHAAHASISPIHPDIHYLFHPTVAYGEFLLPGILVVVFQQVLLVGLAYSAGLRKEDEMDDVEPPTLLELYGRAAAQLPFYLFTGASLILFFQAYNWPLLSPLAGALLFVLFTTAVLPLGLLVSTFVTNQFSAFNTLMFLSAPLLMISGFAMPLFAMPRYLQGIAMAFPTTPALALMRMISNKSTELTVLAPHISHLGFLALIFNVLLLLRLHRQRGKARQAEVG